MENDQIEMIDAILARDYDTVIEKLKQTSPDFADESYFAYTPLHYAAKNGDRKMCEILITNGGTELLRAYSETGQTPLHCAVLSGSFETCAFLVGFSECNIKAIDDLNRTAVDIAWKNGKAEIVEYFQTIPKCPQLAITVGAEQIEID